MITYVQMGVLYCYEIEDGFLESSEMASKLKSSRGRARWAHGVKPPVCEAREVEGGGGLGEGAISWGQLWSGSAQSRRCVWDPWRDSASGVRDASGPESSIAPRCGDGRRKERQGQ
jgi:hypothetical protein